MASRKRSLAAKKAARTRKRNKAKRSRAAKKGARKRKSRRNPAKNPKANPRRRKRRSGRRRRRNTSYPRAMVNPRKRKGKRRRKARRNPKFNFKGGGKLKGLFPGLKPKKGDMSLKSIAVGGGMLLLTAAAGGATQKALSRGRMRRSAGPISYVVQFASVIGSTIGVKKFFGGSRGESLGRATFWAGIIGLGLRAAMPLIRRSRGGRSVSSLTRAAFSGWVGDEDIPGPTTPVMHPVHIIGDVDGDMLGVYSGPMGSGPVARIGGVSGPMGELIGNAMVGLGMADWLDDEEEEMLGEMGAFDEDDDEDDDFEGIQTYAAGY